MKHATIRQGLGVGLLGVALLASGCQSSLFSSSAGLDNTRFMSLWTSYSDCKVASDLNQASQKLERLSAALHVRDKGEEGEGFVLPFVSALPNRMAVDVRSMAADCSLHKGRLALYEGRIDVAHDAFSSVLTLQQDLPSYYVLQAQTFLSELEQGLDIALSTP